jgi:hypothetical protein
MMDLGSFVLERRDGEVYLPIKEVPASYCNVLIILTVVLLFTAYVATGMRFLTKILLHPGIGMDDIYAAFALVCCLDLFVSRD